MDDINNNRPVGHKRTMAYLGGVIALVVLVAVYQFSADDRGTAPAGSPELVIGVAENGVLTEVASGPGNIEPRRSVTIYSQVSAAVQVLPVGAGDPVNEGDLLVKLDDRILQSELDSKRAALQESEFRLSNELAKLEGLRKDLVFVERRFERLATLHSNGEIPLDSLENTERDLEAIRAEIAAAEYATSAAKSALEVARAQVQSAERDLEFATIDSPMTGIVTGVYVEVGEAVLGMVSNVGTRIMEVADMSQMILRARVAEADIVRVGAGQQATVFINAYPDKRLSGRVSKKSLYRSSSSSVGSRNDDADGRFFDVELAIDATEVPLFPGMSANVEIEIAQHEDIIVDSSAILSLGRNDLPRDVIDRLELSDDWERGFFVFVVEGSKVRLRPVVIGASSLNQTVVASGLEHGESVVLGPYSALRNLQDGQAIRVGGDRS